MKLRDFYPSELAAMTIPWLLVIGLLVYAAGYAFGCIRENRWESQIGQPIGTGGAGWGSVSSGGMPSAPWGAGGAIPPHPNAVPPVPQTPAVPGAATCYWPSTAHCDGNLQACEPLNSLRNCGACGQRCAIPGARVTCRNRYCEMLGCQRGRGDCDFSPHNGCETFLQRDLFHCGGCGISCAHLPGATAGRCEDGECVVAACLPGLGDCNEEPQDGCEEPLNGAEHCGACDRRCGDRLTLATCLPHGQCQFLGCATGAADCGGNGRCVSLSTSDHCGGCEVRCPQGQRCQQATQGFSCEPPRVP